MQFELERTVEILAQTPATLRAMLGNLSDSWIESDEGPDTWSPFDVVWHLILGDETDWMTRLARILEEGEAQIFKPSDRFAQDERSRGKTMGELLDTFAALREANLQRLKDLNLQVEQLELSGTHPLGRVTIRQLLATWAVHDLGHIAQIARAMAAGYSDEVGPWRAYLRVLGG